MEPKISLNVEGMTCTNCALTVAKVLERDGLKDVNVNFVTGEVTFENTEPGKVNQAVNDINRLGYKVIREPIGRVIQDHEHHHHEDHLHHEHVPGTYLSIEKKFYWCLVFSFPLVAHMFLPFHFLQNPVLQLILCLPVMFIGVQHFGKSAWLSVKSGVPNMDVLIAIGSGAAFLYSLFGMIISYDTASTGHYLFFETAAAIITLVLLGNLIEQRSVKQTTTALHDLNKLQASKATKISILENGNEATIEVSIEKISKGDLLLVNTGDKIPLDGKIKWGTASINEAMVTGESLPVSKTPGDEVIGGTLVENGSVKMIVERTGSETVLAKIIELVRNAQNSKPPIQKAGDRVSAVFVPSVVGISAITFMIAFFIGHLTLQQSIMNSIAVLVISCPCAMGLATPTAVMVGIGRAAKNGILIKGGSTLESFAKVKTIVFDKTGTLTTGDFKVRKIHVMSGEEESIRILLYALERHSSHPIAKSIVKACNDVADKAGKIRWTKIDEDKGVGIHGTDEQGNLYSLGSIILVKHLFNESPHNIFLLKNNKLLAALDVEDEIKEHVKQVISELNKQGIKTVMVSGDKIAICKSVAEQVGIMEFFGEQLPQQKLDLIKRFSKSGATAMVGDGINDAPALASATVGVSLSSASQVAIQSAQIILLQGNDLRSLLKAIQVSKHTLTTIKQNLFWAFFYNVLAIPVAAFGFLSPMIGALSMAFSDVIVIGNSIRLKSKKIF